MRLAELKEEFSLCLWASENTSTLFCSLGLSSFENAVSAAPLQNCRFWLHTCLSLACIAIRWSNWFLETKICERRNSSKFPFCDLIWTPQFEMSLQHCEKAKNCVSGEETNSCKMGSCSACAQRKSKLQIATLLPNWQSSLSSVEKESA